ncbi:MULTISPECIES: hypothetical protein [Fischerella]|uniref:Uncharacterized protein n=1 Tax=Fischerella muscicola CCMEE 5323 TaxID=2019572 RepID=A0A2N6JWJ6_FISMU|nr:MULTISPECIES: hypothetical protein [Fischerella]MBD2430551.1 hypothetical protein [Fischerella sp. FACHB-380]PLZ84472.1 hypothetical protein CEN44_24735 [Fischerella muscicola CCMEE 5323]
METKPKVRAIASPITIDLAVNYTAKLSTNHNRIFPITRFQDSWETLPSLNALQRNVKTITDGFLVAL